MCGHVAINCVLLTALQMQRVNELYILKKIWIWLLNLCSPTYLEIE